VVENLSTMLQSVAVLPLEMRQWKNLLRTVVMQPESALPPMGCQGRVHPPVRAQPGPLQTQPQKPQEAQKLPSNQPPIVLLLRLLQLLLVLVLELGKLDSS